MATLPPQTPFEVQRQALLGFRQEQVLRFMRPREEAGLTSSLNEIALALGLDGKGHACNIVNRLKRRGEVHRDSDGVLRIGPA